MNKDIVRINAKLYHDLWKRGGDKLLATYCMLKNFRAGEIKYYAYTSKNNKFIGGYSLLRAKTNLSLHSLEKYVPALISMGLCFIDKNGDFVLLGGERTKELYSSRKLVPIKIGKNLIETATNCLSVRCHAKQYDQNRMIAKKKHRSELIFKSKDPRNLKEYKLGLSYIKKYGENIEITDKAVLSNDGFCLLKFGKDNLNYKAKGQYWKQKLVKAGIITSSRRFEILQRMSYPDFLQLKKMGDVKRNQTYIRGGLAQELTASFLSSDLVNNTKVSEFIKPAGKQKIKVKPLKHLSFDFIAWCINEE